MRDKIVREKVSGKGNFGNGKPRFGKDEIPRNKKWEN